MVRPVIGTVAPGYMFDYRKGAPVPEGWVLADGRAFWIWQHRDIFKAVKYTYGRAWFGLKWRIPDMRSANNDAVMRVS